MKHKEFDKDAVDLKEIEKFESLFLNKYYHFLRFAEDDLIFGFKTKYKIKDDWFPKWDPSEEGKGISDFATGAERIVYALLNGKGIGQPNSAPIGADLFFEVENAFIHIDLKTVQTRNIGDYTKDIFVGNNQNSYNGVVEVNNRDKIYDGACLPHFYTLPDGTRKVCLTYFITILYEEESLDILNINILSMPNGALFETYGKNVLKAGKVKFPVGDPKRDTHAKTIRYKWAENLEFKLLHNKKRIKVAYFNTDMKASVRRKLKFIEEIYNSQGE